jgi:hypothetical protein
MPVDPLVRLREIRDDPDPDEDLLLERDALIRRAVDDNYMEEVMKAIGLSQSEVEGIAATLSFGTRQFRQGGKPTI